MKPKNNVLVLGVSYFEGMAGSMRVRNLIDPLLEKEAITLSNMSYIKGEQVPAKEGNNNGISYKLLDLDEKGLFSIFGFLYQGCAFIKKTKRPGQKNILYHYDSPDIKSIVLVLYAKLKGYKILFDIVEDNRFFFSYSGFMNKLRVRSSIYLSKKIPSIGHSVIAISSHLTSQMKEICKNKIPVTLVPITVNFKFFNKEFSPPGRQIKIFYGGSFAGKDGLKYLIEAFEMVAKNNKNVILILTGKGASLEFKEVMNMISNSVSKEQIDYKGYLSNDEYYALLNECDIFCMTRNNSGYANAGFPFKLGEFLASGKAVIATNVGDVSNYLQDGVNSILIKPESAVDIANAINHIVSNPSLTKQLGTEARKTAKQHFDSELLSQRLYTVFSQM